MAVLKHVFRLRDIETFRQKFKGPLWVNTWDDSTCVWMTAKQIQLMSSEAMIIGPLAAMFGREIQQKLMAATLPSRIASEDIKFSVESGRTSLSQRKVDDTWNLAVGGDLRGDRSNPDVPRTRSPRRTYEGAPWQSPPQSRYRVRDVRDVRDAPGAAGSSTDTRIRRDEREPATYDLRYRENPRSSEVRRYYVTDDRRPSDVRRRSQAQSETRYDRDEKTRHRRN